MDRLVNSTIRTLCLIFVLCGTYYTHAQTGVSRPWAASIEFQAYPTGLIPGIRIQKAINDKGMLHIRSGYNLVDHRDLGEHEDETGGGLGGTIGYDHFINENYLGWFFGPRVDLWFNTIDWKDNIGEVTEVTGTSDVIVMQPTLEAGYRFQLGSGDTYLSPTVALGMEINVKTEGEEVGQGVILLLGILLSQQF